LGILLARSRKRKTKDLKNIFHKNREISILTMKKKTARLTLPQEATERTKQGDTKNKQKTKITHRYEQKCQSHTCSGTKDLKKQDKQRKGKRLEKKGRS
jgi:hypothetical protein